MLSAIFSTSVVGYYALGDQLLRVPMNLIGISIGQAFYPHAVAAHREGRLAGFVEDTFRRLVEYSCFPILILIVIGRDLFLVVFGSEWTEAGVYTQILSIWMLFWFISSPMHHLFNVLEKNELALGLNLVILLTRIGSIWLGGILNNPYYALLFYSLSGAMVYGYTSMLIVWLAGTAWSSIVRILLVNLFLASCAIVAILTLRLFQVQTVYQLIAATVLVVAYYLYRFRSSLFSIMIGV
jgi:O-antigen/teichoic acid export membrane protein